MNGPEILHLIRHELQGALARRGKPPTPQPMEASPWLAMSTLQKSVRRRREDLALSAAATLLQDAPDKFWRRIGCIAYEDVGLASLEAVGLATVALEGKRHRAALGGEWAVASCVVAELSRAPKCRAADDLLMACELHPGYAEARAELPYLTTRDLITVATRQRSVHERALALWYALGTDRRPSGLVSRRGEPRLVFDNLCEAGWPHSIVEIAREGFRRTGIMLCPLVALLSCEPRQVTQLESDELPPEGMIGDIPSWAIDLYSREGRAALARFLQTDAAAARWVRRNVSLTRRVTFFGHIVFRVEGGLVVNRMRWPLADELRRQVDFECSGPDCSDAAEILELTRADLPLLNEARAAVAGSFRHAL
jgi:MgsA AAA+ ATPase C terminal